MSGHGYEGGRLNLPFVGIPTFAKAPYQPDWDAIEADVAILGAPFDGGTQYRPGARFGPRAVREASTLFSFGHAGAYDHEDDAVYLDGSLGWHIDRLAGVLLQFIELNAGVAVWDFGHINEDVESSSTQNN